MQDVWYVWGNLDPIAIICLTIFVSMFFILMVLLIITQRKAAREASNAIEECTEWSTEQRDEMRRKRHLQMQEMSKPEQRHSVASYQSTVSTNRRSTLDPYKVPIRKPVPNRQSQQSIANSRPPTILVTASEIFISGEQQMSPQHQPLFFQTPGYQPIPIFDQGDDASN